MKKECHSLFSRNLNEKKEKEKKRKKGKVISCC